MAYRPKLTSDRGGVRLPFADPRGLICFDPVTQAADYNRYLYRLSLVSQLYADVGEAMQDYNGYVSYWNTTLTPQERRGAVFSNIEYPWLTILDQQTNVAVDPSWQSEPHVISEFARQGVTLSGSTTLSTYKQVAVRLWRDIANFSRANGVTDIIHYGSTTKSFLVNGAPRTGFRNTAAPSGTDYFQGPGYQTVAQAYDDSFTFQAIDDLVRAQDTSTAFGAGIYNFAPNTDAMQANLDALVGTENITRRNSAGSSQTPVFTIPVLRHWVREHSRRVIWETRRIIRQAADADRIPKSSNHAKIAAIVHVGGGPPELIGSYIHYYHWWGPGIQDNARAVEDEVIAWRNRTTDTEGSSMPDQVWVWGAPNAYFCIFPFNNVAGAGSDTERVIYSTARIGLEKTLFNRPRVDAGEPLGFGTSLVDHNTWILANNMGDSFWATPSALAWTPAGGNQLPAPCSLTPSSPLAPWLNFNINIRMSDVRNAIRHYMTDLCIRKVEMIFAAIN